MNWRTIGDVAITHTIASYASMAAIEILAVALDGRVFPDLIWWTAAAPVGVPWTVIEVFVGEPQFGVFAAAIILAVYSIAFFFLWGLRQRRETPRGFPVLPARPNGEEPPR